MPQSEHRERALVEMEEERVAARPEKKTRREANEAESSVLPVMMQIMKDEVCEFAAELCALRMLTPPRTTACESRARVDGAGGAQGAGRDSEERRGVLRVVRLSPLHEDWVDAARGCDGASGGALAVCDDPVPAEGVDPDGDAVEAHGGGACSLRLEADFFHGFLPRGGGGGGGVCGGLFMRWWYFS